MNEKRKTALVTGANRGLGFETARELALEGYHLLLTSRNREKGSAAARRIATEARAQPEFHELDVEDEQSIGRLAAELREAGVRVDLLINNAAVALDGFNGTVARRTVDTNFYGPVRLTEALLPLIPDGGTIVMVSSGAGELSILSKELQARFGDAKLTKEKLVALVEGFVGAVNAGRHSQEGWPSSAYGVSKAALNAYVRVTAPQLSRRGVRINAVCPGWVRTDMGGAGASRSVEQGAASILWAAHLEEQRTGGFYRDGKPIAW